MKVKIINSSKVVIKDELDTALLLAPFRLCFRLEEPEDCRDNWRVEYWLQSRDDPSMLVVVSDAHDLARRKASLLKRTGFDVAAYVATALAAAGRISDVVADGCNQGTGDGFLLAPHQVWPFIEQEAPRLVRAGFALLLPECWRDSEAPKRLQLRARFSTTRQPPSGHLTLAKIGEFRWEVVLGESVLSDAELAELADSKMPLVRMHGRWLFMTAEELEQLAAIRQQPQQAVDLFQLVQLELRAREHLALDFIGVEASGWAQKFLNGLRDHRQVPILAPPAGFHGQLRPYQLVGYSWLYFMQDSDLGACLADDMGLGKTIQALALMQRKWEEGERRPVLLICPTSVLSNWYKEAERFVPSLSVQMHHGGQRLKGVPFQLACSQAALVLTSFALLLRDLELLQTIDWSAVIVDEAQNIKNAATRQYQAARSITATYRLALTGTPVENSPMELWALMHFLNPGLLGSEAEFAREFSQEDSASLERLRQLTSPFLLRRLKRDSSIIADLPEKNEGKVYCNLTQEQATLYQAVLQERLQRLRSCRQEQRSGLILELLTRLKQICNHPAQFLKDDSPLSGRSGKLTRLQEMLEEIIANDDRALIFTQFTAMGKILQRELQQSWPDQVLFLHGGVSRSGRGQMIEAFQQQNGPHIFVVSLRAGGTGLNLTRANHVFHYDRWWNPAVEIQATDRAYRIGQSRAVQVYKFLCAGTVEDKIDAIITAKENLTQQVIVANDNWIATLSNQQLQELLTLEDRSVTDDVE